MDHKIRVTIKNKHISARTHNNNNPFVTLKTYKVKR